MKETKMIYKKLLEFQKQNISVKKSGINPHFKSTYPTLNDVLEAVKPALNKLGVIIVQTPIRDGLYSKLIDTEDDTFIESILPYVEVSTAQKLGSNNTYNRRYALITMLGLEDEDDDGTVASKGTPGLNVVKNVAKPKVETVIRKIDNDDPLGLDI